MGEPLAPSNFLIVDRVIGRYHFEGGPCVAIVVYGGAISTAAALDMVDVIVGLKREELSRKKALPAAPPEPPDTASVPLPAKPEEIEAQIENVDGA